MTVKELIELLETFDENLEVKLYDDYFPFTEFHGAKVEEYGMKKFCILE